MCIRDSVNTRQGLPLDRAWSLMRRDYGCCGTEKPAKRGEVESALRLGQRPNECDALANRASCEAHPVAHVNTRQGLPLDRAWSLMPRDYGCCGTEKPAKRGEVESPSRRGGTKKQHFCCLLILPGTAGAEGQIAPFTNSTNVPPLAHNLASCGRVSC